MIRRIPLMIVAAISAATALAGCGRAVEANGGFRGTVLAEPIPRPDFVLTDTRGEPYDFRAETNGYVTLLFFGYTHCPDVCPIHMGSIAAVLGDVGWRVRNRIKVVFVTTDPDRDTPERIRAWLDRFDPGFIGLRGSPAEIARVQRTLNLAPSVVQPVPDGGSGDYLIGHAAQVLAFGTDGPARVVYPFGTRQSDWAHDLPLLVADAAATPAAVRAEAAPEPRR